MKKLSLLLLVLMLTLALSACFPTAPDTTPPDNDPPVTDPWASYETITIAQALELCGESGNITTERYYIRAKVDTILNPAYGQMVISDETGSIEVYGTYSADGEIGYAAMTDKFYKGDEVLLHCILQNYNGTKEIKNARLIDFKKAEKSEVNEKDYKAMDIVDARAAAKGEKVKLTGVVARITFANGMMPILIGISFNCVPPTLRGSAYSVNSLLCTFLGNLPAPTVYGYLNDMFKEKDKRFAMRCIVNYIWVNFALLVLTAIFRYRRGDSANKSDRPSKVQELGAGMEVSTGENPPPRGEKARNSDEEEGTELQDK